MHNQNSNKWNSFNFRLVVVNVTIDTNIFRYNNISKSQSF